MDQVLRALRDVRGAGRSLILVLRGERGIGKTAFAAELAEQARRMGFSVAASQADDLNQAVPWSAVIGALRSGQEPILADEDFFGLARLLDQQGWLVARLASLVEQRSRRGSVLVAIDDVQRADRLSVVALRAMLPRLARSPVVWLLTTGLDPEPPGLADGLAEAVARDVPVRTVELGPLAPGALRELAADHLGTALDEHVSRLLAGADGNPQLAVELIGGILARPRPRAGGPGPLRPVSGPADGSAGVPGGCAGVARGWLARLPPETRRVLQAGAVLGRSFEAADAAAVLGGSPDTAVLPWLAPAVRIGVLSDRAGSGIEFRHELVRRAVYENLPASIRRVLHAAAADRLLATGASPVDAARHVLASAAEGDLKAVETLRQAAARIAPRSPAAAAEMILTALSWLGPDDLTWPATGVEAITILTRAHRAADAVSLADRLLAARPGAEDQARIESLAAAALWELGRLDEIRARADRALTLGGVSRGLRARLQAARGLARSRDADSAAALRDGRAALREALLMKDEQAQTMAWRALGEIARNSGHYQTAAGHFRQLRGRHDRRLMVDEILTLQALDHYEASERLLGQLRAARGADAEPDVAYGRMWQDYDLGRFADARTSAVTVLRALDGGPGPDDRRLEARLVLASLARLRGDVRLARRQLGPGPAGRPGAGPAALIWPIAETYAADMEGDLAAAVAALREVVSPAAGRHRLLLAPDWLMAATRIAVQGGAVALAGHAAERAETMHQRHAGHASYAGAAAYCRGLVLADTAALESAVGALRPGPRPLLLADAQLAVGKALLAADHDRAVAALDEAWEIFHQLGALGEVVRVQRVLRSAGVRRRRYLSAVSRPEHGWEALTAPERRVARLVAAGCTNRSVAAELGVSPNTVATQLRAVFKKLEVSSRVQLALLPPGH